MARHSVMFILLLALFGLVSADQICIQTKNKANGWKQTKYGGTNCPLRVKAYVKNYGWKYAFIDKYSSSNWRNTEYGQAYVSKQRVHEHTDTCFEMQAGFGNVDLNKEISVRITDPNCNDALWIDRFFIPGRKFWGASNIKGWCMNGRKYLENDNEFEVLYGSSVVTFNDGCALEWELRPNGQVHWKEFGSTTLVGSRGSGRRALREVEPVQDFRFMGLANSERREISLIESLYDVCEDFDLGEDFHSTDRYERETEQIVHQCYDMLSRFQATYQEFQTKEERAIFLAEEENFFPEERAIFSPSEETERSSKDSETSESDTMNRLMSKIRSLP
jgi:hypothetical protein